MKIVIIGAASNSFGRGQIADILLAPEFKNKNVTLSLVDINELSLSTMTRYAERLRCHSGTDIVIEHTTDRRTALPGADYVIVAVARMRYPLWEQDFRVPLAFGFRHCLGENGGPGALFHTMRSLELIIPICRDIEQLCPDALMLNFTNPEARVLHAICHLTKVKAAGICHGVSMGIDYIARLIDRPPERLEVTAAGMNHFYAVTKVIDTTTGIDLLPLCKERVLSNSESGGVPLFRKMLEVFDVFTFPSDDHIGEYLSFGAEYCGVRWHYGQETRKVGSTPFQPWGGGDEDIRAYGDGTKPLDKNALRPSGELTVPIIADILLDRKIRRPSVNVLNHGGLIDNLPAHGAVEVPAIVDADGIHPLKVGPIPEPFASFLRTQYAIHETATEAYRTKSKTLLLRALLLDPAVNAIASAETMLEEMLKLQQDFLPSFH